MIIQDGINNSKNNNKWRVKMSVHKKLTEARVKLLNTTLKKSGLNKFAGFQYFELGDFLPAITNIFSEVGLCGVVSFSHDLATLTITDIESGKEILITSPLVEVQMKGCLPIQGLGAQQTYIRRYLWVTAMEIVEHDALDANVGKPEPIQAHAKRLPALTPEQGKDAYEGWIEEKMELAALTDDGIIDPAILADHWGAKPSNVRTAIKNYGDSLKTKEQ
jgi:hypothetical protein